MNRPCVLSIMFWSIAICLQLAGRSCAESAKYNDLKPDQFMRRWLVLGPLSLGATAEAAKTSLFQADLLKEAGGEATVEPSDGSAVEVAGKTHHWRIIASDKENVDLQKACGAKDWSVAYAWAEIHASSETQAFFGIGSDDAVRVWLNGELVHDQWVGRSLSQDDDLVPIQLRLGRNRLLLKVLNRRNDWGFSCRLLSAAQQAEQLVGASGLGDAKLVERLLAAGIDINSKSKYGLTAMHAARIRGQADLVDLLASRGADRDAELPEPASYLDAMLADRVSEDGPGISALISRAGEIVLSKSYGLASLEHDVPVTAKTKFRIGSVTKQFTAAAILKLQEDGQLKTTDPLSKFVPDFPRGDEVTIHHLLTHTSGIHSYTSNPNFYENVAARIDPQDLVESIKQDAYDFSPGEKWMYNNSGYFLLGYIIQQVSGKSYADYLHDTFFQPLGMNDTGVHTSTAVLKHEATGYAYIDGKIEKALDWDMSRAGGAGALYSTVEDLQTWNEAVFEGKLLSEESLRAAFTPVEVPDTSSAPSYGYGWIIDQSRGLRRISHGGGLHGFVSAAVRFPEQEVTIVVLHNASPPVPGSNPNELAAVLAEGFLWSEMTARARFAEKQVDTDKFDDYVGQYDYGAAVLTVEREKDRMFAQLTGQPRYEIFPTSETKFFWKVVDAQVEFLRDEKGKVVAAEHTQNGRTFKAPRLKEKKVVEVPPEVLDTYVGKYDYKRLGTLTIRRQGKQLLAQMTGQPELPIFAKSETEFFWKVVNAEIKFIKGADGKVEKLVHSQGGGQIEASKIE